MNGHDFVPAAGEPGISACRHAGCTVRRDSRGGWWQRAKGGRWIHGYALLPVCIVTPCGGTSPASSTCSASWPNGSCDRPRRANGLCQGHNAQRRRAEQAGLAVVYAQLRGPGGADPRGLVSVTVLVPAGDVAVLSEAAAARGAPVSELYREAVADFTERLRGRQQGSPGASSRRAAPG